MNQNLAAVLSAIAEARIPPLFLVVGAVFVGLALII